MLYRTDKKTGNQLSALGLGCMRFPRNKSETEKLILDAIDGGVNYFDTAYIYPNSEATLGEILAKYNKRKDVYIATKLPLFMGKSAAVYEKIFQEQLRRLQTDYIDYYFMHSITDMAHWQNYLDHGIVAWLNEKRAAGQIKHVGFSYHGTYQEFVKVLDSYDWEFCMIQYNYYDEHYQAGRAGLDAAAAKGIAVMIMEPLLGGALANGLPQRAKDVFHKADASMSPVDWAFHWLWHQPAVTVVLSGMGSSEQLKQNIASASNFTPLADDDFSVYAQVKNIFSESYKIPCTGCNYCLPCPQGINIPGCFSSYNTSYFQGYVRGASLYYTTTGIMKKNPNSPHKCNQCGKCEKHCPQHIPIRQDIKKVAKRFEPLPLKWLLNVVRKVVTK